MKILLIGKTGQLGSVLLKDLITSEYYVIAPSRKELDILHKSQFKQILKEYKPDIVINTAAFNNVSQCEIEPIKAFQTNCIAVKEMAETCYNYGIKKFITFSTDYIFNGFLSDRRSPKKEPYIETDPPSPLQMYGLSKLAGEYGSLIYSTTIIIRTCGLYGSESGKKSFIDKIIESSFTEEKIEISNDQTISSTYTEDLSRAILKLISHPSKDSQGRIQGRIYHLINEGYCTWYELTKEAFDILSIDTPIIPIDRKGFWDKVRRPLFSALKNEKAKKLGIVLPYWKDALKRYILKREIFT